MSKVRVILSTTKKWNFVSFFIKLVLKTKYSHTALEFYDSCTNQYMIYEASNGEAHYIELENWLKTNIPIRIYSIEIPKETKFTILREANKTLQTKYSVMNIILNLTNIAFGWSLGFFKDGKKGLICSEAVGLLLKYRGINFNKDYDLVTPKDIESKMESLIASNEAYIVKIT